MQESETVGRRRSRDSAGRFATYTEVRMDARKKLRSMAVEDAIALVDRLVRQAAAERWYGRVEINFQDGIPQFVREEQTHQLGRRRDPASAAA